MQRAAAMSIAVAAFAAISAFGAVVAPGWPGGSIAAAQPRRGAPAAAPPAGNADRREQIKKRIRALRAFTLTEELALDESTAGRLFPVLARYDDETDRLLERRVEIQRRLRHADTMRDPRQIDRLIDEAIAAQHGFWDLEDKRLAELRKILTPVQIAKLLIVLPALERRIQNQLQKAISQRRPGAPVEDDDDPQPDDITPAPTRPPRSRREGILPTHGGPTGAPGVPGNTPRCDPTTGACR